MGASRVSWYTMSNRALRPSMYDAGPCRCLPNAVSSSGLPSFCATWRCDRSCRQCHMDSAIRCEFKHRLSHQTKPQTCIEGPAAAGVGTRTHVAMATCNFTSNAYSAHH